MGQKKRDGQGGDKAARRVVLSRRFKPIWASHLSQVDFCRRPQKALAQSVSLQVDLEIECSCNITAMQLLHVGLFYRVGQSPECFSVA